MYATFRVPLLGLPFELQSGTLPLPALPDPHGTSGRRYATPAGDPRRTRSLSRVPCPSCAPLDVRKPLLAAARPRHFHRSNGGVFSEAESQCKIALRTVARTAVDHLPLLAGGALDPHQGSDGAAIRFRAYQTCIPPVILISAVVPV